MLEIKGILFDMDGVLVDSEAALRNCCIKKLRDYGIEAAHEDFIPFTGMGEDMFIGGVAKKHGKEYKLQMKDEIYALYGIEGRKEIIVAPKIKETIEALKEKYKLAIASSADLPKVLVNLSVVGVLENEFGAIITGSDVKKKKPDPEIYLFAAEKIGIPAKNCVVVEDAISGVKAAKAAGCYCIAVGGSFTKEQLFEAGADKFVENTYEILQLL